jgi:diguanylate cyclase (GGDEF)-like protein
VKARELSRRRFWNWLTLALPFLVAAAGIVVTIALHRISADNARDTAEERFRSDAEALVDSVVGSVEDYELLNGSTIEVIAPRGDVRVTREEFSVYSDSLLLPTRYPAAFGIGWADAVPVSELMDFLSDPTVPFARLSDLGPDASREVAGIVTYGGPASTMAIAMGVDAMKFPPIAEAFRRSWATGEPALSGPLRLPLRVGPNRDDPPTLTFLLQPVLADPEGLEAGSEESLRPILGWGAVLFDMTNFADLASSSLGDRYVLHIRDLDTDSGELIATNGLEALDGGRSTASEVVVFGRHWGFTVEEAEGVAYGDPVPNDSLVAFGLAATAIVFVVVMLLTWSERRARRRVEKATAELTVRAATDDLTGLANRAQLEMHINDLLRSDGGVSRSLAVLYLDLDRFKLVNDSLGHAVGDELLREVAARLLAACAEDHVVGRLGGDEFVVVVPAAGVEEATGVAQRVMDSLLQPFVVGTEELYVQVSIGIALADAATDADGVLQRADAAMYAAKESEGAGIALFTPSLMVQAEERLTLARDLRRAVDQRQFRLVFQSINKLGSHEVVGYEALVRWTHPTRGLLLPGSFLVAAKETGLIDEIDAWVRGEAMRRFAEWDGTAVVSVNVSARDLEVPGFSTDVLRQLHRCNLDPRRLVLEITETELASDPVQASRVLGDLRADGVRVAVDDFGTGYSGLSNLRSLPADLLKVDRSLVAAAPLSPEDLAVLRVIIELGHALGMEIVAEGVEVEQHLTMLTDLGCDLAQGWYFGQGVESPWNVGETGERRGSVAQDRRRSRWQEGVSATTVRDAMTNSDQP